MLALWLVLLMALTQSHYRFGVNDGTEATHTWHAAEDANPAQGVIPVDTTFLLRFTIQADATGLNNLDAEFQVRKNGGAYQNITTTSTIVKAVTPTTFANAAHTTKRLSGTGTFESSSQGCTTDGIAGGAQFDIVASGNGETICGLQIVSADVVHGDVLDFRLTRDGGTLLDTYSVTPSITVSEPTNQTVTAGTPTLTLTAPAATRSATVTRTAGTPSVTLSAPAALLTEGGDTLLAGTPVVTFTAPSATRIANVTHQATTPTVTFSAPAATRLAGAVTQIVGTPTVLFTAPTATLTQPGTWRLIQNRNTRWGLFLADWYGYATGHDLQTLLARYMAGAASSTRNACLQQLDEDSLT